MRLVALFGELAGRAVRHVEREEAAALPLVQETVTMREWKALSDDQRRRIGLDGAGGFSRGYSITLHRAPGTRCSARPPPLRLIYRLIWEPRYRRRSPLWPREPSARG